MTAEQKQKTKTKLPRSFLDLLSRDQGDLNLPGCLVILRVLSYPQATHLEIQLLKVYAGWRLPIPPPPPTPPLSVVSEAPKIRGGETGTCLERCLMQRMRSPKTPAKLKQRNIFEKQYFGWPNQPSSDLDVEGWYGQPKYCFSNITLSVQPCGNLWTSHRQFFKFG